ncbi:MAG: hypothetical protein ABI224_16775 [Acetobacteraceae bacterium]
MPAALTVQSVEDVLAPISRDEGWNTQTERTLLIRFLDDLALRDPTIPGRLQQHLRAAADL